MSGLINRIYDSYTFINLRDQDRQVTQNQLLNLNLIEDLTQYYFFYYFAGSISPFL